jgi:hypothetical protein
MRPPHPTLLPTAALILSGVAASGTAHGADLKDPTRPPASAVNAPASVHVALPRGSAVFISADRRVAIFNDQPVQVGEHVGRYLIEAITAEGVRYSSDGHSAFAALGVHP